MAGRSIEVDRFMVLGEDGKKYAVIATQSASGVRLDTVCGFPVEVADEEKGGYQILMLAPPGAWMIATRV